MPYCYYNGKIVSEDKVGIHPRDLGVLRGFGVFDLLRTHGGEPLLFDEHFARFERSAKKLGLVVPISHKEARAAVDELLLKNKYPEVTVRFVLTGGVSEDGIHIRKGSPTLFILVSPFLPLPEKLFREGVSLDTKEHLRELPEIKSLNYLTAIGLHNPAQGAQPLEVLYTWQGRVLEATMSNFFMVQGDTVVTPRRDVLLGTTRNLVLELAKGAFQTAERDIFASELVSADEAFLTATNKDILPVARIDGKPIGKGAAGRQTRKLMELFDAYLRAGVK